MLTVAIEAALEVVPLVWYATWTLVLTSLGLAAEYRGLHTLATDQFLGGWLLVMGLVALYAGVIAFGRDRFLLTLAGGSVGDD